MESLPMLENLFLLSLQQFFDREPDNITSGVAEQNLCARLAIYLEINAGLNGLNGYYADAEYNRKQNGAVKTILDDEFQEVTIQCDLILHSRGESIARDNLIAIEMKKSTRPESEKISNRNRLRTMTKSSYGDDLWSNDGTTHPEYVCGYELGYFIEINIKSRSYILQKFESGELIDTSNGGF